MNLDSASRNFFRDIIAKAANTTLPGNQRNASSRDARGVKESVDMGQNVIYEEIDNGDTIIGFGDVGA